MLQMVPFWCTSQAQTFNCCKEQLLRGCVWFTASKDALQLELTVVTVVAFRIAIIKYSILNDAIINAELMFFFFGFFCINSLINYFKKNTTKSSPYPIFFLFCIFGYFP